MFLIFGSSGLGLRLAKWCSNRHRCTLVGLAHSLPIEEPLENCEIIASSGVVAEISSNIVEINLFESIFSSAITGNILFTDTNGLINSFLTNF